MITEWRTPVQYYMDLESDFIIVNQLIGKKIRLEYSGYKCLNCSNKIPIFRQGFCKKCFFEAPQTASWITKPELSKAHRGVEDRDLEYEKQVQLQPHIVYLANSGGIKVGVTRKQQIPTRWIDQGATLAKPILETPNRYLAGVVEVTLKQRFSDKTNWRKMLTENEVEISLESQEKEAKKLINRDFVPYFLEGSESVKINYPVEKLPVIATPLNFEKKPTFEGILRGIKGQYWIFEDDTVCNIRNNEGKIVNMELLR
ncbi:hypothetical protein ElyMa_002235000 [Elysia marginata]|uniref:DUF2797 domain-containing protein n=1 Tax=Elysia marginata TaxID=1093978 RepID=A0AAV4FVZ9_9GAST|nr:hypothetical protein ElyMa_002235000 [Elysia marginata]